jgi:hypothetical protein
MTALMKTPHGAAMISRMQARNAADGAGTMDARTLETFEDVRQNRVAALLEKLATCDRTTIDSIVVFACRNGRSNVAREIVARFGYGDEIQAATAVAAAAIRSCDRKMIWSVIESIRTHKLGVWDLLARRQGGLSAQMWNVARLYLGPYPSSSRSELLECMRRAVNKGLTSLIRDFILKDSRHDAANTVMIWAARHSDKHHIILARTMGADAFLEAIGHLNDWAELPEDFTLARKLKALLTRMGKKHLWSEHKKTAIQSHAFCASPRN